VTEHFDAESAKRRYEQLDDAALARIANSSPDRYVSEAIALARSELSRRGGPDKTSFDVSSDASSTTVAIDEKSRPLHGALKAFCFVLTPIPALVVALWQFASGRNRAGKDALIWMLIGLVTWSAVNAVLRGN